MRRDLGLLYQGKVGPTYKDRSKWKGWFSGQFVPLSILKTKLKCYLNMKIYHVVWVYLKKKIFIIETLVAFKFHS